MQPLSITGNTSVDELLMSEGIYWSARPFR